MLKAGSIIDSYILAQLNWTYYSLSGARYLIEMYHGDQSGHMMLLVNGEIIKIDFSQLEDNIHNFMIDQQMIELKMVKKSDGFDYIVTPQPVESLGEPVQKDPTLGKHFWLPLIFLLVILNLAFYLYKSLSGIG